MNISLLNIPKAKSSAYWWHNEYNDETVTTRGKQAEAERLKESTNAEPCLLLKIVSQCYSFFTVLSLLLNF